MKETLQEKVETILKDLVQRQKNLQENIAEYKLSNSWEDAMKCDIRLRTLETVRVRLVEALS